MQRSAPAEEMGRLFDRLAVLVQGDADSVKIVNYCKGAIYTLNRLSCERQMSVLQEAGRLAEVKFRVPQEWYDDDLLGAFMLRYGGHLPIERLPLKAGDHAVAWVRAELEKRRREGEGAACSSPAPSHSPSPSPLP
jgi:hypothetical protein